LLTDSGEPECYEDAMQVDTKKKWEQGMKDDAGASKISSEHGASATYF
jgi:hypothetical protein